MTIQLSSRHVFSTILFLLIMLCMPQYANALSVAPSTQQQITTKVDDAVASKGNTIAIPQPRQATFVTIARDTSNPNRGSGSIFATTLDCDQAFAKVEGRTITAVPYAPASNAVTARDREGRPAILRPVFSRAELTQMEESGHSMVICGGEETSVYSSNFGMAFAQGGAKRGDWIVGIPAESLYTDGTQYFDIRCVNRKWSVSLPRAASSTQATVAAVPMRVTLPQPTQVQVAIKPPAPKNRTVEYNAGTITYIPVIRQVIGPARVVRAEHTAATVAAPEITYTEVAQAETVEVDCPEAVWVWQRRYLRRGEEGVSRPGWYDVAVEAEQ